LKAAEVPAVRPDVLIVESTHGVQNNMSREERETRFTKRIDDIVSHGGKCLIPVFALGRAQELLLILDEYWQSNPRLQQKVPVYYVSKLSSKAMRVYQTFINVLNARISALADISNPFQFQYIRNLRHGSEIDESSPCVVMATSGMLESGLSRKLCERYACLKISCVSLIFE
jgi:cleavage and polyadenylation specificity factor subunit 3